MPKITTEICVDSIASAKAAQTGGGHRIELCSALALGGLTPSYATLKWCTQHLHLPIFVLIRPRSGDFWYSEPEFELMLQEIDFCKQQGAKGVVVGFLKPDGSVDFELLAIAVQRAQPMEVTFHRAFDLCNNWQQAVDAIIAAGANRILTSGMQNTAWQGKGLLKELVQYADNRITILPGSGINAENARELAEYTRCTELHFSAKTTVKSQMNYLNTEVLFGNSTDETYNYIETSAIKVAEIVALLNNAD